MFSSEKPGQVWSVGSAEGREGAGPCAASHLLCESDKVQLFSFSMRTLVRISMYINKCILNCKKLTLANAI